MERQQAATHTHVRRARKGFTTFAREHKGILLTTDAQVFSFSLPQRTLEKAAMTRSEETREKYIVSDNTQSEEQFFNIRNHRDTKRW